MKPMPRSEADRIVSTIASVRACDRERCGGGLACRELVRGVRDLIEQRRNVIDEERSTELRSRTHALNDDLPFCEDLGLACAHERRERSRHAPLRVQCVFLASQPRETQCTRIAW